MLLCALLAFALVPAMAEARRLALIVGNADYSNVTPLNNAVNDAVSMSEALTRLGFEVTLLTDPESGDFWRRLDAFSQEAETAESTLFFYSGHAFQMSGVNYLVPVGAELSSRESVQSETWNLDGIIARLQNRNRQTLIFLDACRNDPLPGSVRGSGGTADGLARLQTGVGTFVAFATEPGAVTYDGGAEAHNSPFTAALLNHIETPGLSVSDLMINVRNEVEENTFRRQTPWDQSSLRSQFYFRAAEDNRQELSAADFELLAQLTPEDRTKFLDLLRASGFSAQSLADAEAAIEVASLNLEVVAGGGLEIGAAPGAEAGAAPDAGGGVLPEFDLAEETVQIGDVPGAAPAPVSEPEIGVAEAGPAAPEPSGPAEVALAEAPPEAAPEPAPDPATEPVAEPAADPAPEPEPEIAVAALDPQPEAAPPSTVQSAPRAPGEALAATAPETAARPDAARLLAAVPAGPAPVDEPLTEAETIRIAALTGETRGINGITALTVDRLRVAGEEVSPDNEEGRALLASIDPRLVAPEAPADDLPEDITRAVQAELQRLGCYTMRVDGVWGPGSRTAVTSYFLAKMTVPDTLEPTAELWRQLAAEPQVVCEVRVARAAPRAARQQQAAPAATGAAAPARAQQAAPAPQQRIERALIGVGSF